MAIAFVSGSNSSYDSVGDPTAVSGNCAAGSGNNVMVGAYVYQWSAGQGGSPTCTFDGNSMTLEDSYTVSSGKITLWSYAAGNNPGTASVSFSDGGASSGSCSMHVWAFSGAKQSGYSNSTVQGTGTSNDPNINITPPEDNTAIVAGFLIQDNEDPTVNDETEIVTHYPEYGVGFGSIYYLQTTAAQRNMDLNKSGTETWHGIAWSFDQADTGLTVTLDTA